MQDRGHVSFEFHSQQEVHEFIRTAFADQPYLTQAELADIAFIRIAKRQSSADLQRPRPAAAQLWHELARRSLSGRRAPRAFRQTDVTCVLKAARTAGFESVRVEIGRDGKMVIETSPDCAEHAAGKPGDALDQWIAKHARAAEGN